MPIQRIISQVSLNICVNLYLIIFLFLIYGGSKKKKTKRGWEVENCGKRRYEVTNKMMRLRDPLGLILGFQNAYSFTFDAVGMKRYSMVWGDWSLNQSCGFDVGGRYFP